MIKLNFGQMKAIKDYLGKPWMVNQFGDIAFIHLPQDPDCNPIVNELKKIAPTVKWGDTYAGPIIKVKEEDADKIPQLIQIVLNMGHRVFMNDCSRLILQPHTQYSNYENVLLEMYQKGKEIMSKNVDNGIEQWRYVTERCATSY